MQCTGREDKKKKAEQDDVTGPVLLSQGETTGHRYTTAGYKSFW